MRPASFFLTLALRRHLRGLLLWLGTLLLLFAVYGLYGLPWGPAVYTALLVTLLALALWIPAAFAERARLRQLRQALRAAPHPGPLPPARDELEQAYTQLAAALERHCRETEDHARARAGEAARYYTLWSHQIKTPIAAMRLLLQEGGTDRHALEQELFKTEQYVEMVLQYQRLETPTRDLLLRAYPLDELVRRAVRRMSALFIHKKIALSLAPLEGAAVTDEKWLGFVLEQLLSNAVKYTSSGGTVSVSAEDGKPASLVIADTGIGIRPEDLPRVTEWGYTGYNGRLEQRSTGVGLALCRQTLDMLGHTMRIESQVGVGTRVILGFGRHELEIE